ncbi:sugar ABC transporter permease [Glycomyces scopariae]|uniref:Multiple sugar transport system permease protein n=1 Tax=Glycomyces sambucus TaxID=380244 RepID=A0A1G9FBQ0_9ACTN|nr:sugar ABC transporter permease [Glycomyces sambucus]SDK85791.1 multiple sugar transport system permease protein [Glycomyces sambucus]
MTIPSTAAPPAAHEAGALAAQAKQRKRGGRRRPAISRRGELLTGYTFMTPWIIGSLVFTLGPMLWSLYLSFTDYHLILGGDFIGLDNYTAMFADPMFSRAVKVTLLYVVLAVPLKLLASLAVAMLLTQKRRGIGFYRAAFYMPSLIAMSVGMALVWKALFAADGPQDQFMSLFGWEGGGFIGNPDVSILMLVLLSVWTFGAPMVIFMAGLLQVPGELYEAAEVDGAGKWHRFVHITIPMLSPVIFFNVLMETVHAFQMFGPAFIIGGTAGGPAWSTLFYTVRIYALAFVDLRMGYASAWAWMLVLAVGVVTLIMFRAAKNLVYYAGEDNK